MVFDISRFLTDDIDQTCRDGLPTLLTRLVIILVTMAFLPFMMGPLAAILWSSSAVVTWLWVRHSSLIIRQASTPPQGARLVYLGGVLGSALTWTMLTVLYWSTGEPAQQIAAIVVLFSQLTHAEMFSFRSKLVLILNAGPPIIALIALPAFLGGFHGAELAFVLTAVITAALYIMLGAVKNRGVALALYQARVQAAAAAEAKAALLAVTSHELRTPLNGLLGMARALQLTPLSKRAASQVRTMIQSGGTMLNLLNDLLDFSKIDAGKLQLEVAPFEVRALGESVLAVWEEIAQGKGLSLSLEVSPETPAWLEGDAHRLRQILQNFVSNAVKFTAHGHIELSIRALPGPRPETILLNATVKDTGIGMTAAQLALLFTDYVQADPSIARRFGGTGLGLAICRRLADLMDGEITATSRPCEGSTFQLRIPLAVVAPPQVSPQEETMPPQADLAGRHILVVDDNRINLHVACAVLEAFSATTITAEDGSEALAHLKQTRFDLVLMDVRMPGMDGIEALKRIRAGQAGVADIPIIALTADSCEGNDARLLGLGFDAVQAKPVSPMALGQSILDCLSRPRASAATARKAV